MTIRDITYYKERARKGEERGDYWWHEATEAKASLALVVKEAVGLYARIEALEAALAIARLRELNPD